MRNDCTYFELQVVSRFQQIKDKIVEDINAREWESEVLIIPFKLDNNYFTVEYNLTNKTFNNILYLIFHHFNEEDFNEEGNPKIDMIKEKE